MKADLPPNESERLKALQNYEILDTTPEREFDDITLLASQICGTPIAMISLVDENRQWFKSKVGLTENETSRDLAFCAHGILQADVFTVQDALLDERFASNPLVTSGPKIRFYAGAPLISPDGHALGMLCVNDQKPRTLSFDQQSALQALSRQVVAQLELRRTIVQLKQKDRALRTSEERFRELAENVTDVFWMTSPDLSEILYINPAYETIWGRSMASLYADPHQWLTAILPEDLDQVLATFSALGVDRLTVEAEYRIKRPDGSIRWIHDRGFQIRDASGKVLRTTGIAQDITERKSSEEQLKWKTALLEAQLDATIDGVLIVDNNRRMVLQNQRFVELFQISSNVVGEPGDEKRLQWVVDLIKEPKRFTEKVHYLYAHPDEVSRDELELVDGRILDRFSAPVVGKDHEYFGRIWTFRDMTERKREADKLRDSEEKFRQLAENIHDVFWMTSPDLRTTLYISPAYERVWGRSVANASGDSLEWSDAIVPEERERVFAAFGSLTAAQPNVSVEFQIVRPDGERRWIHSRGVQVRDSVGKVIRLAGIASDITDRKNLEAKAFQSQKMETVGKLAGGIAHEFNSILTAIIGQCELLLTDLPAGDPLAKNATEIRQAANRAATLTRQLLAYGRKQLLQPESLDFNRVISSMEGVFQLLIGADVKTQINRAPDLKPVMADAGQIEQVIMNMVINAREAMPRGGILTLETGNVSFEEESIGRYPELKAGDYAMLAITDSGVGMDERVKARLFEPFFTTKAVGQGTGLGLSTCYGIIKQSGGHISVYTEVGRGTSFKIYLPHVDKQGSRTEERKPASNLPRGSETILLVEDDPALREMSATLLKRLGYKVWTAANGVEGLSLAQRQDVGHLDLLLTDVVMPHMSGKELADRVESIFPNTKILFTSAYTETAIVHQGALNKGVTLLQKPFTPSALAQKVREVLEQAKKA